MSEKLQKIIGFVLQYLPAAVPSTIAALEMARDVRERYQYGGSTLAPLVGIFLCVLFVMVGSSAGRGFANALASNDYRMTVIFLIVLCGYGAGEWIVNPIMPGKIASVFVVAGYIVVPLALIIEQRASFREDVRRLDSAKLMEAHRLEIASMKLQKAELEAQTRQVKRGATVVATVASQVAEVATTSATPTTSLTPSESKVLWAIAEGHNTQVGIAEATAVHKSTVSRAVKSFTKNGIVLENGHGLEITPSAQEYLN